MTVTATHRDSSLELYRVIVMLAIVAHHYVVNSGLLTCISGGGMTCSKLFLLCFGAWGKVGINCFVLITGYFMCTSDITLKKFLKLYLEVVFYSVVLNSIFAITGYAPLTWRTVLYSIFPVDGVTTHYFWGAFLVFFLTIPFLNILVNHMTQRQHALLLALLIPVFTILPFFPGIDFAYNHVEWFAILYFISSYLRKYPNRFTENRRLWIALALLAFAGGLFSVYGMTVLIPKLFHKSLGAFYFLSDANKFTALAASFCFFLAFKPSQKIEANSTLRLQLSTTTKPFYSPLINTIASATFGVLLIHANSNAMRRWLWHDVCNCRGWFEAHADSLSLVAAHFVCCVFAIFSICSVIDLLRQRFIEKPFFNAVMKGKSW